jgi:hypothetical protein
MLLLLLNLFAGLFVGVCVGYLWGAAAVADLEDEIAKFHQVLAEYKTKLNV